jgi:hypothetical protein
VSETPLCDAALASPLGVPPGLDSALRGVERGARAARARLRATAERGGAVPAVGEALARLDEFLEDPRRSPLRRALKRPLRQIAVGTPGWRRLDASWRAAVLRADAAARLQDAVEELRGELARVTARFGGALPYWTRWHLEREKVTADHIEQLRRDDARKSVRERLRFVESELERLHAHLPPSSTVDAVQLADAWPTDVAPGELLAAAALRLAERHAGRGSGLPAIRLRHAAARHLHALGAAGEWRRVAHQPEHTLAEQLAAAAVSAGEELRWTDDGPLWAGLVAAAQDAAHGESRRDAWQPQPHVRELEEPDGDWGATVFAVPLSPDYVLLTPETPSAVRVSSRRVGLGAAVECAAFSGAGGFATLDDARRDVAPLFDGLADEPAWYRTARKARLKVLAKSGDAWLARLDSRGELARAPTAGWSTGAPRDARLRVLLDGLSAPPVHPVAVGGAGDEPVEFCGLTRHEVEAPYAGYRRLWLRTAEEGGDERLKAEHELFRGLARSAPGAGLRPAGRGRMERPRAEGYLYVPPFAFAADESPPVARWMAANPVVFIVAAAKVALSLARSGMALGVFHRSSFAFRVEWTPAGVARPVAIVSAAPFAGRLGEPYARFARAPEFGGLGARLLPSAVVTGAAATAETEAQAWALFALDLLATKRLPPSSWSAEEVASVATVSAGQFFHIPNAAERFGAALRDGARALTLLESVARAGEPRPRA